MAICQKLAYLPRVVDYLEDTHLGALRPGRKQLRYKYFLEGFNPIVDYPLRHRQPHAITLKCRYVLIPNLAPTALWSSWTNKWERILSAPSRMYSQINDSKPHRRMWHSRRYAYAWNMKKAFLALFRGWKQDVVVISWPIIIAAHHELTGLAWSLENLYYQQGG